MQFEATPSTQEVQITITLTIEADTKMNKPDIRRHFLSQVKKIKGNDHYDIVHKKISDIKEEAEIYGND